MGLRCRHLGLLCKERPEGSSWLPTSNSPALLAASLAQEDEVEIQVDSKPRPLSEVEVEVEIKPTVATNGGEQEAQGKQQELQAQAPLANFAPPVAE